MSGDAVSVFGETIIVQYETNITKINMQLKEESGKYECSGAGAQLASERP